MNRYTTVGRQLYLNIHKIVVKTTAFNGEVTAFDFQSNFILFQDTKSLLQS